MFGRLSLCMSRRWPTSRASGVWSSTIISSARSMAASSRLPISPRAPQAEITSTCDSASRAASEATWVPAGKGFSEFHDAMAAHAGKASSSNVRPRGIRADQWRRFACGRAVAGAQSAA